MGKGLIFFCCSCCILVLTIVNLSIGPIINGSLGKMTQENIGTLNCELLKDNWDTADKQGTDDDTIKYREKYLYDACIRKKGMHDMEYTAFIFDIVIGFVCGLIGLLHLFDLKKDFVSNTGLIGLICGIVGFALTFVYVIFNGLVYTTVYALDENLNGIIKRDGDYAIAEKDGDKFKCLYFDHEKNTYSKYAKISDLGKKQYNYDKDGIEDYLKAVTAHPNCEDSTGSIATLCTQKETITSTTFDSCDLIYIQSTLIVSNNLPAEDIENKDLSDRFLTTLILSLIVCLANIGLALFGFLLFRTPGDF